MRYTYGDPNAERVILDDVIAPMVVADTGDLLPGPVDGVLDYSFGNFKLEVLATPAVVQVQPYAAGPAVVTVKSSAAPSACSARSSSHSTVG